VLDVPGLHERDPRRARVVTTRLEREAARLHPGNPGATPRSRQGAALRTGGALWREGTLDPPPAPTPDLGPRRPRTPDRTSPGRPNRASPRGYCRNGSPGGHGACPGRAWRGVPLSGAFRASETMKSKGG